MKTITSNDPKPAHPDYALPFLGKPFKSLFPHTGEGEGNMDRVVARYEGSRPGTEVAGWGWDRKTGRSIERVLIVADDGIIVGVGKTGFDRPDVPDAFPHIRSNKTGWRAVIDSISGPVMAWGILGTPQTVCRLGYLDLDKNQ